MPACLIRIALAGATLGYPVVQIVSMTLSIFGLIVVLRLTNQIYGHKHESGKINPKGLNATDKIVLKKSRISQNQGDFDDDIDDENAPSSSKIINQSLSHVVEEDEESEEAED